MTEGNKDDVQISAGDAGKKAGTTPPPATPGPSAAFPAITASPPARGVHRGGRPLG